MRDKSQQEKAVETPEEKNHEEWQETRHSKIKRFRKRLKWYHYAAIIVLILLARWTLVFIACVGFVVGSERGAAAGRSKRSSQKKRRKKRRMGGAR